MAQSTLHNYDVYQPRNPKASTYYKCVENHFEELERAWDGMYASVTGFILQKRQVLATRRVTLFGPALSAKASLRARKSMRLIRLSAQNARVP